MIMPPMEFYDPKNKDFIEELDGMKYRAKENAPEELKRAVERWNKLRIVEWRINEDGMWEEILR